MTSERVCRDTKLSGCAKVANYKMLHLFFFLVTGGSRAATIASSKTFLS